ncbi:MAG: M48 family peptidase, partial [Ignavibacteria bacterium]
MEKSKQYNRIKITLQIINQVISFLILIVLAFTPLARLIEEKIYTYISNDYVAFMIFLLIIGLIEIIFSVPLDFYSTYIVEHRFNLSNQKVMDWLAEKIKSYFVSTLILFPLGMTF